MQTSKDMDNHTNQRENEQINAKTNKLLRK
jgi:hypothetical protein